VRRSAARTVGSWWNDPLDGARAHLLMLTCRQRASEGEAWCCSPPAVPAQRERQGQTENKLVSERENRAGRRHGERATEAGLIHLAVGAAADWPARDARGSPLAELAAGGRAERHGGVAQRRSGGAVRGTPYGGRCGGSKHGSVRRLRHYSKGLHFR